MTTMRSRRPVATSLTATTMALGSAPARTVPPSAPDNRCRPASAGGDGVIATSAPAGRPLPVLKHRLTFAVQVYLVNDLSPIGIAATSAGTPSIPLYRFDAGRSIFSISARI